MKPMIISLGLLALTAFSCHQPPLTKTTMVHPDTAHYNSPQPGSALAGIYRAVLPCADCAGIEQIVQLKEDYGFHLQQVYIGKSPSAIRYTGTWQSRDGIIQLQHTTGILASFLPEGGKLIQLSPKGDRITGEHAAQYILLPQEEALPSTWEGRAKEGVSFFALGNEPFWSLAISDGRSLLFTTPENNEGITFPFAAAVNTPPSLQYESVKDENRILVTVTPEFCSDGMSDRVYDHRVTLSLNGQSYSGCGLYLHQQKKMQQLHGEWVLDYIHAPGKDPKLLYEQQQPHIRFDTAGKKVAGSTGCNRFNGPYITENHHLHFDMAKMALTRMACKGEGEGVFLDALKKVTRYTFSEDMLLFLQDDMVIMRWKKKS